MIRKSTVKPGDRVRFNNPVCCGHNELATVSRIETDKDGYDIVWIRWDKSGLELGNIVNDDEMYEWVSAEDTGLKKWLEG